VVLQVKDDGRGFNESKTFVPGFLGAAGMRERALLIGAGLEIRSRPREGTMVTVVLPGAAAESNGQQTRTTRRDHIIVDDHSIFRHGLKDILARHSLMPGSAS